jgi:pimeloyl-ACP methyl ester carboxylesterase
MGLFWDPFLDALAESYTVYAPEFPGTTPGKPDEVRAIDTLWDLVLYYDELFEALGIDSAPVVGHSFGGMLAAEIAASYPSRVSKLVLLGPIGLWRDDEPVRNWMLMAPEALPPLLFADPTGPLASMLFTPPEDPDDAMNQAIQTMWNQAVTGKFVWPIPDKGLKKRLHRVKAPTLLVWGKQDGLVPPVYAGEFAQRLGNVEVQMVDGAGHLPHLEQPQAVLPKVKSFLAS